MTDKDYAALEVIHQGYLDQIKSIGEKMTTYQNLTRKRAFLDDILSNLLNPHTTHATVTFVGATYGVDFPNRENKQWLIDLIEADINTINTQIDAL